MWPHKVTQHKKSKVLCKLRELGVMTGNSGYSEQTKPVFHKKAETTKKIMLRLDCAEPNCRSKRMLAVRNTSTLN